MKVSKRAIKELFINNEFATLLKNYFAGDFDPWGYEHWMPVTWGPSISSHSMDMNGAKKMKRLAQPEDAYAINITQPDDNVFSAIVVDDIYGAVLRWVLDLIGFKYEEMKDFDAYKYDDFNMWMTTHGNKNEL